MIFVSVKDPLLLQRTRADCVMWRIQFTLFFAVLKFWVFLLLETVQGLIPCLIRDGNSCRTAKGGGMSDH